MSTEPITGRTYQEPNSVQTDALQNDELNYFAAWVNCAALSVGDTAPPGSPANGDRYIVGASATGAWAGHDDDLAVYRGGWQFYTPNEGIPIIKDLDSGDDYEFVSGAWSVKASGSGSGYPEGTSFPGSPSTNDKFFRTDLGWLCYFDGTRWLTAHEHIVQGIPGSLAPILAANSGAFCGLFGVRSDYQLFLTRLAISTFVGTTNDGSNYWTAALERRVASSTPTSITSVSTIADSVSTMTKHDVAINAPLNAAGIYMTLTATKTGSPGSIFVLFNLYARLIVT